MRPIIPQTHGGLATKLSQVRLDKGIIASMQEFRFFHPIEIRYGDLDPQGHLNNAKYLTFFEQARVHYVQHLGLWQGGSFLDVGIILAEARVTFKTPVQFKQAIHIGARTTRLGNKSFEMEYTLRDIASGEECASGSAVLVAYDYRRGESMIIPKSWRDAITKFEMII